MSVVLLILAILGIVVVVSAVLENTAPMAVTVFGQEMTGLSDGEWLAVAAGLGALIMLLLALSVAFTGRRRARRHDLRADKDELADRVADLERENYQLRESAAPPRSDAPTARSEAPPRRTAEPEREHTPARGDGESR